jgi:tetratricopeptide (TPR) repeat protein
MMIPGKKRKKNNSLLPLIVPVLLLVSSAVWGNPGPGDAAYQRGLLEFESKNYAKAESSLLEAVAQDPADSRPCLTLALLYDEKRSDFATAVKYYRQYILLNGEKKEKAHEWLRRIMTLKCKFPTKDLKTVQQALALYNAAVKELEAKKYDNALARLNDSIALVPYFIDSIYARGLVYYQKQSYLNALRDLEDVNMCDESYKDIAYYLGLIYDIFSVKNRFALAFYNRYLAKNDVPAERRTVVEAIVKNMRLTEDLKKQAYADYKAGRFDKAESAYKKAVEIRPDDIVALNNIGIFYLQRKDLPSAEQYFTKARGVNAYDASPYYNMACLYCAKKDRPNALLFFRSGLPYMPEKMRAQALTDEDLLFIRDNIKTLLNE